jgi:hypothetical protein
MANLNNMGSGRKLLDQVLSLHGPRVKHWYDKQNLVTEKTNDKASVDVKTPPQNPFKK